MIPILCNVWNHAEEGQLIPFPLPSRFGLITELQKVKVPQRVIWQPLVLLYSSLSSSMLQPQNHTSNQQPDIRCKRSPQSVWWRGPKYLESAAEIDSKWLSSGAWPPQNGTTRFFIGTRNVGVSSDVASATTQLLWQEDFVLSRLCQARSVNSQLGRNNSTTASIRIFCCRRAELWTTWNLGRCYCLQDKASGFISVVPSIIVAVDLLALCRE